MTRILAIRPEPGLSSTLNAARDPGLAITGVPLFEIHPLEWKAPDPDSIDALLIGSANAIRHGGQTLTQFHNKPVHAVGESTKKVAAEAGFTIRSVGAGGLQNVLDNITPPARLLRIAGAEHVPLTAPRGITITTVIAYESVARPLDPAVIGSLDERVIVLLHSAAAARHFASECARLEIDRGSIELAALGPRIASSVGKGWGAIHVCEHPDDAALLAMVHSLCQ